MYALTLVSALPLAFVLHALAPREGDPVNCGGIGFGETPCGWDAVALTFVLFGAPYALCVGLLLGLGEFLGPRLTRARSAIAIAAFAIPWMAVAFAAHSV